MRAGTGACAAVAYVGRDEVGREAVKLASRPTSWPSTNRSSSPSGWRSVCNIDELTIYNDSTTPVYQITGKYKTRAYISSRWSTRRGSRGRCGCAIAGLNASSPAKPASSDSGLTRAWSSMGTTLAVEVELVLKGAARIERNICALVARYGSRTCFVSPAPRRTLQTPTAEIGGGRV
jgi:hypothetical protein